jgi:hypothetical protein
MNHGTPPELGLGGAGKPPPVSDRSSRSARNSRLNSLRAPTAQSALPAPARPCFAVPRARSPMTTLGPVRRSARVLHQPLLAASIWLLSCPESYPQIFKNICNREQNRTAQTPSSTAFFIQRGILISNPSSPASDPPRFLQNIRNSPPSVPLNRVRWKANPICSCPIRQSGLSRPGFPNVFPTPLHRRFFPMRIRHEKQPVQCAC